MFVKNASIHSFIFGRSKKVDHSDKFENSTEMSNDSTDSSFTKAKKNFTPGILFTLLVEQKLHSSLFGILNSWVFDKHFPRAHSTGDFTVFHRIQPTVHNCFVHRTLRTLHTCDTCRQRLLHHGNGSFVLALNGVVHRRRTPTINGTQNYSFPRQKIFHD